MSVSSECIAECPVEGTSVVSPLQTNSGETIAVMETEVVNFVQVDLITLEEETLARTASQDTNQECSESVSVPGVSNVIASVENIINKSPVKKNRRKKKSKVSDNSVHDRPLEQNGPSNETALNCDIPFNVEHLNEVFGMWSVSSTESTTKRQSTFCSSTKLESANDDRERDMNSRETVTQVSEKAASSDQGASSCASSVVDSKSQQTPAPGVPKSNTAEKIRKKKKSREEKIRDKTSNESHSVDQGDHIPGPSGVVTSNEHTGSEHPILQKSKSAKGGSKKKYVQEGESKVKATRKIRAESEQSTDELYQLLSDVPGLIVEELQTNESEAPVRSKSEGRSGKKKSVDEGGSKANRRISHELKELEKIAGKIMKQDGSAGGSTEKKKKKERAKMKKGAANASTSNSTAETSTSKQTSSKEQRKEGKKKPKKQFEEYWKEDAVKEGLSNGTVIEGVIRINPKSFTEAYVSSPAGSQDILIEGIVDRNRALEGDLVALLLKDPSQWRTGHSKNQKQKNNNSKADSQSPTKNEEEQETKEVAQLVTESTKKPQMTGKVVAILSKQHPRKCVGYLKLMKNPNDKFVLFSPRDVRVPRLHIPHEKCPADFRADPKAKQDILYLARILRWANGMFALGEIVEQIGETGDVQAETAALLLDNDLDVSALPEAFSEMYATPAEVVREVELGKREDLRKECIFTIDPLTAKDLDDAVSCKELENGNFEIGVHISDVSFFLDEGTALDNEVSKRATTVYLVDKVYHMLPVEMCLLCSLLPGQDKLAYSVIWEITRDAKIVSQRIVRTVINSCVKLAYEHAQAILDNPDKEWNSDEFPPISNDFTFSDIKNTVKNLHLIAVNLRNQRFEEGSLRIDQTKLYVRLDPSGMPVSVHEYINTESNRLIEEFMLLANMTTAKFVYDSYPDIAFLRCHPEPHRWLLEQLQDSMATRGIHINVTSAGGLQGSLTRYSGDDFLSKTRLMVLNALCAKTMARAKYFCAGEYEETDFWHYALSVPFYTHFTSPIRRYADVMVHRLLNGALGYHLKPSWTKDKVAGIAANCNKKKYSAKIAGEQSVKLFLSLYIRDQQPVIEEAVVIDVKDHSFDVIVCKYGLTLRVYTTKLDVEVECCTDSSGDKVSSMKIIWKPTVDRPEPAVQVIEIFTVVQVKIQCGEGSLKLETSLICPSSPENFILTSNGT